MKKPLRRMAILPAVLAVIFIVLDLLLDRYVSGYARLDWTHLALGISILLASYFLMNRAVTEARRAEDVLKQARDELEARVTERTAELEQLNQDLRTSEETARALINASPAASLLIDPHGIILATNETVGRNLGVTDEQLLGGCLFDFFPPEVAESRRKHLEVVLQSRQPLHFVDERAGRTFDNHVHPVVDADGAIIKLAIYSQDITARMQVEALLRETIERLEYTQAAAGAGSWDWDIASARFDWSAKTFELFGLDPQIMVASYEAWRSVIHPDDREAAEERINLALAAHAELQSEYRIILPHGQIRWISALGRGAYDDQGQPTRMSGICLDITARKLGQARIQHLSSFPELNPNPVVEVDASGAVTFHNPAAMRVLGQLGLPGDVRVFFPEDLDAILRELGNQNESRFQREVQVGSAIFAETIHVIPSSCVVRIYGFDITERVRAQEALRLARLQAEEEKRYLEAVLQTLPVGVVITDTNGGVLLTNGMDVQIWGPRPTTHEVDDYVQYQAWWADSGKPVEVHEWASARAVQKGESIYGQMLEIQRFDGGRRFILNSAVPVRDREGQVIGSAVAVQDITELRRTEQELAASEAKYRLLFQNMAEGFALYELLYDEQGDPVDWQVLEVNNAYEKHTGIARDRIVGRRISELFPAAIPEYLPAFVKVVDTQTPIEFETYARAVGRHQRVSTFPAGGRRFASIVEDITRRKESEEALRQAQAELALDVQRRSSLEERQRLARELHDSVSQALYGISLGVHTALTLFDTDRVKTREALDYALSLAHAGLAEMRALIFELRPESLEKEGLVAALVKHAEALRARHRLKVDLSLCDEPDVPLSVKEALYRIAQEALQNAVKHAHPERLDVRLTCSPEGLRLEVCDDGAGFDPSEDHPGHLGLQSMRERALNLGGALDIVSDYGCGTQIYVSVPIPGWATTPHTAPAPHPGSY